MLNYAESDETPLLPPLTEQDLDLVISDISITPTNDAHVLQVSVSVSMCIMTALAENQISTRLKEMTADAQLQIKEAIQSLGV